MRKLLTLSLLLVSTIAFTFGQYRVMNDAGKTTLKQNVVLDIQTNNTQSPNITVDPIGTVSSSSVTSIKVGEASNAYTYLLLPNNQITTIPGMGTGGVVGFLHRQNSNACSGNNGQYRYSLSTDGGQTWNIGGGNTVPPNPSTNTCWGNGPLNADIGAPTVTDPSVVGRRGRYPNFGIFSRGGSTSLDSLSGVYSGPVLLGSTGWDGYVTGVVTDLTGTATVTDEVLQYQDDGSGSTTQYFCHSMVQTHPDSNVWYFISRDFDPNGGTAGDGAAGRQIILNRGVYDNNTRQMTWTTTQTWTFNFTTTVDQPDGLFPTDPAMAFAPDGQKGYIGFLSDLAGQGKDTTFAPVMIETTDGGLTWGTPFELDLHQFPELLADVTEDTFTNAAGDFFWLQPYVTTGFEFDLEVDKNGNPHFFTMIGGNKQGNTNPANNDLEPGHGTIYGLYRNHYDITKDSYGDWNMVNVSPQATLRGYFGDLTGATADAENFAMDAHPQVSRSADGSRIFYSWMDTDTTINGAIGGPTDANGTPVTMTNYAPNLFTFALNVDNYTVAPVVNWTGDDQVWASRVVGPRMANVVLQDNNSWILPTMVMELDGATATDPVSFHYFSDVMYDESDFSSPAVLFYNCKENPFANTAATTDATCGNSDGSATVTVSGGLSPYTYEWSDANNTTMPTASSLAAGIYTVTVTDDFGCTDELQVTVNDAGAATLTVDNTSVNDPNCFNTTDGTATVTAMGGTGTLTYSWSPSGETTAAATMLPGGVSTVTVTDAAGCESRESVTLNTPPVINLSVSGTDITCFGDGDGTAVAIGSGGSGTLGYVWNGDASLNTSSLSMLAPGPYSVVVTDENGCQTDLTYTVVEPAAVEVASIIPTEVNNRFRLQAAGGGGTPIPVTGYTYNWRQINGTYTGTGAVIFNRPPGCYEVTITDANGCTAVDTFLAGVTSCTSGIADEFALGIETFKVYPNPTKDVAFVAISLERNEDATIQLLDLAGKTLRTNNVSGRELNVRMDLSTMSAGVYLVRVNTERGSAVRKLIVR